MKKIMFFMFILSIPLLTKEQNSKFYYNFVQDFKKHYDSLIFVNDKELKKLIDSVSIQKKIPKDSFYIINIPRISYYDSLPYSYFSLDTFYEFLNYINPCKVRFECLYIFDRKKIIARIYNLSRYWGKANFVIVYFDNYIDYPFTLLKYLRKNNIDTVFEIEGTINILYGIKNNDLLAVVETKNENNLFEYHTYKAEDYIPYNIKKHIILSSKSMAFQQPPPEKSKFRKFFNKIYWFFISIFSKYNC